MSADTDRIVAELADMHPWVLLDKEIYASCRFCNIRKGEAGHHQPTCIWLRARYILRHNTP